MDFVNQKKSTIDGHLIEEQSNLYKKIKLIYYKIIFYLYKKTG